MDPVSVVEEGLAYVGKLGRSSHCERPHCGKSAMTVAAMAEWNMFQGCAQQYGSSPAFDGVLYATFSKVRESALAASATMSDSFRAPGVIAIDSESTFDSIVLLLAAWRLGACGFIVPRQVSAVWRAKILESVRPQILINAAGGISLKRDNASTAVHGSTENRIAFLVATSGSSGSPRVVAHTERSLAAGLMSTIRVQQAETGVAGTCSPSPVLDPAMEIIGHDFSFGGCRMGLSFLSCSPIWTTAGFTVALRTLLTGECLVVSPTGVSPKHVVAMVKECGVNCLQLSPFLAQRIVRYQHDDPTPTPSLLTVGVGGSVVPAELVDGLEAALNATTIPGYGSSETAGPVIMARPSEPIQERRGSIGRPLPGVDVVLQPIAGEDVGSRGELVIRTPSLMQGYLEHGRLIPAAPDGWWPSGDIAERQPGGRFAIMGRVSDVIVRGGFNIDPHEIELFLQRHCLVRRAAVVGSPSRVIGEEDIRAFVTLKGNAGVPPGELLAHCREGLPNHLVPRTIRIVDQFPLAADGKISRARLRASAR